MVILIIHDGIEVVVVGHGERNGVRISLTKIGLRVEGNIVLAILIPIDRRIVVLEGHTVTVVVGIVLCVEEFPAAGEHLVESGVHIWCLQAHGIARQHGGRRTELSDLRHTALEFEVDIDDMQFIGHLHTAVVLILIVRVLVDHGDDLLLHHIVGIRLTADVERGGLGRLLTLDDKVLLIVGHCAIFSLGELGALYDGRATLVLVFLVAIIPLAGCRNLDGFHITGVGIIGIDINHLTTAIRCTEVDEIILGDIDIVAIVLGFYVGIVTFVVADSLKLRVHDGGTLRIFRE